MKKSDIDEHIERTNNLMEQFERVFEDRYLRNMSLEEHQIRLIRRLGNTLKRLDLSEWDPRGPNRDAFRHLLPYDAHLTKTPWWKRLLGNYSTYVEYDDSGSKTIS